MRPPTKLTESTYFANLSFDGLDNVKEDEGSTPPHQDTDAQKQDMAKQHSPEEKETHSGVLVRMRDFPDVNNNVLTSQAQNTNHVGLSFESTFPRENSNGFKSNANERVLSQESGKRRTVPIISPKLHQKQTQPESAAPKKGSGSFFGDKVGRRYKNLSLSKDTLGEQTPSNHFGGYDQNVFQRQIGVQPSVGGVPDGRAIPGNQALVPQRSRSPDIRGDGRRTPQRVRFSHEFEDSPPYESYFHEMKSSIEEFENDPLKFSPERINERKSPERPGQYKNKELLKHEMTEVDYGRPEHSERQSPVEECLTHERTGVEYGRPERPGRQSPVEERLTHQRTEFEYGRPEHPGRQSPVEEHLTHQRIQVDYGRPDSPGQQTPIKDNLTHQRVDFDYGRRANADKFEDSESDILTTDSETVCSTSDTSSVDTLTLLESCDFSSDEGFTPQRMQLPTKQKATNLVLPKKPTSVYGNGSLGSFTSLKPRRGSLPKTSPPSWTMSPKTPLKALSPTRMQHLKMSSPRLSKTLTSDTLSANRTLPVKPTSALIIPSKTLSHNVTSPGSLKKETSSILTSTERSLPEAFSPTLTPSSSPFEISPRPLSPGMPKTPRGVKTPDVVYTKTKSPQLNTSLYGYPILYQNPSGIGEHAIHAREEFTLWVNNCLKYSSSGRVVTSLERDLADGVTLIELVKVIVDKQFEYIPKYHINPTIAIQRIENIKVCLEFLESLGMNLTGIIAEEIVEANLKAALAICHCLRKRFPIFTGETMPTRKTADQSKEVTLSQYQSSPLNSPRPTAYDRLAPSLTDSTDAPSSSLSSRRTSLSSSLNSTRSLNVSMDQSDEANHESTFQVLDKNDLAVLSWVSKVVDRGVFDYEGLQNGKVLCHLINKIANYNISDLVIQYSSPLERLEVALQIAEEKLGVFTELTPIDIIMVQQSHLVRDFLCDLWRLYNSKISHIQEQMAKEKEEDNEKRKKELISRYEQEVELCSDLTQEKAMTKQRDAPWNKSADFGKDIESESFSYKLRKIKEQMHDDDNRGDTNQGYQSSDSSNSITDRWKASPKTGVSVDDIKMAQKRQPSRRRGSSEPEKELNSLLANKSPSQMQDNFKTLFSAANAADAVPSWKRKTKVLPSNKQLNAMSRVARMTVMARMASKTGSAYDDEEHDGD